MLLLALLAALVVVLSAIVDLICDNNKDNCYMILSSLSTVINVDRPVHCLDWFQSYVNKKKYKKDYKKT